MSMTIDKLARRIGASVRGDGLAVVDGCAGLEEAGSRHVSFLANRKYVRLLSRTHAAAVIISEEDADHALGQTLLVAQDPYFAFREAVVALHGFRQHPAPVDLPDGLSQAVVDPTAQVGQDSRLYPMAYVAKGAKIGERCIIYPYCFIGPGAVIGDGCVLFPNVTVYDGCVLGNRVTLHSGCVIGQDGFGYATHQGQHHKIPQIGNVVIEDDVEMGACCVVDRATVGSTRIGQGTKFSDLVAIGHGADVGSHNLLVAQVGIGGSTQTGNYVVMGGQVGVAGHLRIGDMAQIAAKAGVADDLPGHGQYGGQPALPFGKTKRSFVAVARLPEIMQEFRKLQKRVEQLEGQLEVKADAPIS